MRRLVRLLSPHSVIVVGGHVAAIPDVETVVDADHIVRGEGIRWIPEYLGEDPDRPIDHPKSSPASRPAFSGYDCPIARAPPRDSDSFHRLPRATSARPRRFFGGEGKFVNFFETGDELFDVMNHIEASLKVQTFFVMDQNFLLHRQRDAIASTNEESSKSWGLAVLASAKAIRKYTLQELVDLGISWVWMGLESPRSHYTKLQGADTRQLTREIREPGIRVQGSTNIGLEHHTRENIAEEIDYAVDHRTDFHQFGDIHGQDKFNFQHAAISREDSTPFLDWAFGRDFERTVPACSVCAGPCGRVDTRNVLAGRSWPL